VHDGEHGDRDGGGGRHIYLTCDATAPGVSLIEDRRNEHGRQRQDRPIVVRARTRSPSSPPPPLVAPSIPYLLSFLSPSPFLRMHVLAETANEDSPFLRHSSIRVRLDLGHREIPPLPLPPLFLCPSSRLSSCLSLAPHRHFASISVLFSLSPWTSPPSRPAKTPVYPTGLILQVSLRVGSSFRTVRPLRLNLTDDG